MSIIIPAYAETESCNGHSHIKYNIENGKVKDCIIDKYAHSIIVNFQTESDGQLTIEIPRDIGFDYMCINEKTFIMVDGQEVKFNEEYSAFSRTFIVSFEDGNTQMEIVDSGTMYGPYHDMSTCVAEHSPIE